MASGREQQSARRPRQLKSRLMMRGQEFPKMNLVRCCNLFTVSKPREILRVGELVSGSRLSFPSSRHTVAGSRSRTGLRVVFVPLSRCRGNPNEAGNRSESRVVHHSKNWPLMSELGGGFNWSLQHRS